MEAYSMKLPNQMRNDEIQTVPVYFRLGREDFVKLKKLCQSNRINTTAMVRNIIKDYLVYVEKNTMS